MNFIEWIQTNGETLIEAIIGVMVAAGVIVGFFNGPKAGKAKGVLERLIALLRTVGIGTYKDEPGTLSAPLVPDTKKRVTSVDTVA